MTHGRTLAVKIWSLLPLLLLCLSPFAQAQLTGVAAEIPNSMFGTFELKMSGATSASPYPEDTEVGLTLAIDGSLCASGFRLRNPFMKGGDTNKIYWSSADIGLEFSLDISGDFAGFGIGSANSDGSSTFWGTLAGEPAETLDSCDFNSLFFELAEANYPELFPESIFVLTRLTPTSFYRYYSVTGVTLGIANGVAYARGGPYQGTVLLGAVEELVESGVDDLIVGTAQPVVLPAVIAGTYSVTFAAAGPFAPIPDGSSFQLALNTNGDMCFDGIVLRTPYQDPGDPNAVYWGNPSAGFVLQLDLGASQGASVTFRLVSDEGLLLGTLAGSRTQLLATCAGVVGNDLELDSANELFALGEQVYPALFPSSPLTFNQFNGASLLRYYPGTGVLVTISGQDVYVSGGAFGSAPRPMGTVDALLQTLKAKAPPFTVNVTGNVVMVIGNLPPITRKIELREANVPWPKDTTDTTLSGHVQLVLGNELKGTSEYVFSNVVSTPTALIFEVTIRNTTVVVTDSVDRTYTLRFVYSR